ncbi:MAG: hypothetical protein IPI79_12575 [Moraxellaceae bacterium]|nr:hypothetical protein [Moraxellaceae bacterium]
MDVATDNNVTIGTALSSLPNLSEISAEKRQHWLHYLSCQWHNLKRHLVFNTVNEVKTLIKVGRMSGM